MADADPSTDDDQVADLKARVAFLEEQISRTLADKATLDARFRAEEADVRKQKAEAIAEKDMWKTRCEASEQERRAGPGRDVEALKAQLRDLAAEAQLKEAILWQRERNLHESSAFFAHRHAEDVRLAEVQRTMTAEKERAATLREGVLQEEVKVLKAKNQTLQQATNDRYSARGATAKEVEMYKDQLERHMTTVHILENRLNTSETDNKRLLEAVRNHEYMERDLKSRLDAAQNTIDHVRPSWDSLQSQYHQSVNAGNQLRSELLAARGEKQLAEREKSASERQARRDADEQQRTLAQKEAVIARLCEQISFLSERSVEPDLSDYPEIAQSKRRRNTSASDVSDSRFSPISPVALSPPILRTPSKRRHSASDSPPLSDKSDDTADGSTFAFLPKLTSVLPKRKTTPASTSASRPISVRSTPKSSKSSGRQYPTSRVKSTRTTPSKAKPKRMSGTSADLSLQDLEISSGNEQDRPGRTTDPSKHPTPTTSKSPTRKPAPFPMKFSSSQSSSGKRKPI